MRAVSGEETVQAVCLYGKVLGSHDLAGGAVGLRWKRVERSRRTWTWCLHAPKAAEEEVEEEKGKVGERECESRGSRRWLWVGRERERENVLCFPSRHTLSLFLSLCRALYL